MIQTNRVIQLIQVVLFVQMFKKVKPARFARFMTEQATAFDLFCVVWAMPKRAFIRACIRALLARENLNEIEKK